MKKLTYPKKLFDTDQIAQNGRVDRHWRKRALSNVFGTARKGPELPKNFLFYDQDHGLKKFALRSYEYGNWLNQEDRYNYLIGSQVALWDLARIVGLTPEQLGFKKKLGLAFGARGSGSALAHFEPYTFTINLTRYQEEDSSEGDAKYLVSGGVGSLGHEWAHALDCYLGYYIDQEFVHYFVSLVIDDLMVSTGEYWKIKERPRTQIAKAMFEVMLAIKFEPVHGTQNLYRYNSWYKKLKDAVEDDGNGLGPYWIRNEELFARAVEVHLFYEGQKKRISNPYLKKTKYRAIFYSPKAHYDTFKKPMRDLFLVAGKRLPG